MVCGDVLSRECQLEEEVLPYMHLLYEHGKSAARGHTRHGAEYSLHPSNICPVWTPCAQES